MSGGYKALRESAASLDLSARGRIRVAGEDRARLLHAICTNHIQQLTPGIGCYAFFLNAQGHILADANVLCFEDSFLLDTEPETAGLLYEHIDKYIIADDVRLENAAAVAVGVEGPRAAELLRGLGAPVPEAPFSHRDWGSRIVAALSVTGEPGFRIFLDKSEREDLIRRLEVPRAEEDAIRTVRLEHGKPRYGEDFDQRHLPQETQQMHALNFNKGCYLGQEIVERIRSRGQVHRLLVPLQIDSTDAPAAGAEVLAGDGSKAGEITSAVVSPALGKVAALAYIRRDYLEMKKPLSVGGAKASTLSS
jgi:folate-binding protein YgfZ